MQRRPPRSTRTDTLFPYTTLFRSSQVPGGKAVFPSLSVTENLELASWLQRDQRELKARISRVHEIFPILAERGRDSSGDLSGGQQQMLALAMSFLAKPRLLLIDELSLGLAPAVVAQMLPLITELKSQGTTVVLVEQSVNVALDVADKAFFRPEEHTSELQSL